VLDLKATNSLCRILADASRLRLLSLLSHEALSVAELTRVTGLSQSRVSTHLKLLKEGHLVRLRKNGAQGLYAATEMAAESEAGRLWAQLRGRMNDPLLEDDRRRAQAIVEARQKSTWADSVAGQMERHYSPGRTWETTARAFLGVVELGEVADLASGDGAFAELIAPSAERVTCVDVSAEVLAAGEARLKHLGNVRFVRGDMHDLPLEAGSFDQAFLMNALTYARDPGLALKEAARVLRPGGRLVATTLLAHAHKDAVTPYDHLQLGFVPDALHALGKGAGLSVEECRVTHEEKRAPHFKVLTLYAEKKRGKK
jgi:SAM-dependent methyltransferase